MAPGTAFGLGMGVSDSLDLDWRLRLAAFAELRKITAPTEGTIRREDMDRGFEFEGERIRFASPPRGRGIWRPRQLGREGAALSIWTAAVRRGEKPRYDDQVASDEGWYQYKYQGADPGDWDNVAVRRAFHMQRPLIYFYGISPGLYEAIWPAYVVGDDPAALTFRIAQDAVGLGDLGLLQGGSPEPLKAYATITSKRRLHQHRFRELVVAAYRGQCTMCRLQQPKLLDAAHILEDKDERGRPEVPNGLSLCKIHHGAYDVSILGISPDFTVHLREDVLRQHDGPMLEHGLKQMHGLRIELPRNRAQWPNREYLRLRFERFQAA